ncbi:MAG: protoglobin domain-containing protein [Verrucomicrobiales bacterium]|nr:protoglobin domain-containing protein [Verrucomicrobiales bacterium]
MPITTDTKNGWIAVFEQSKAITGFSIEDEELIRNAANSLLPRSKDIAAEFYEKLLEYEPTANILKDLNLGEELVDKHLRQWVESLLKGQYDDSFWAWHWVIGLILVQFNLDRVNLTSLIGQLQKILIKKAFEIFRENSAVQITFALINLTSCLSLIILKSYSHEYDNAIAASGLKSSVLNRMISMEVKNKIKSFSKDAA